MTFKLETPIVLIIFKRPDTTERVFEAIRQARPTKLFVIADGPRADRPGESEKCAAARAVIDRVDWDCEVIKNYSEINLGCGKQVASGLDWFFEHESEGIILEDDCLPEPSFFPFCEELLERYREDTRISVISGQNVQFGRKTTDDSYYFSRYNHCWGWASWRRSWRNFDLSMKMWPSIRDNNRLKQILNDKCAEKYWNRIFEDSYNERIDTWDVSWTFSCWIQNQVSILSNVNLVSNIGYGPEGTNTKNTGSKFSQMFTSEVKFPLKHPSFMLQNVEADQYTEKVLYSSTLIRKIQSKLNTFV